MALVQAEHWSCARIGLWAVAVCSKLCDDLAFQSYSCRCTATTLSHCYSSLLLWRSGSCQYCCSSPDTVGSSFWPTWLRSQQGASAGCQSGLDTRTEAIFSSILYSWLSRVPIRQILSHHCNQLKQLDWEEPPPPIHLPRGAVIPYTKASLWRGDTMAWYAQVQISV